MYSIVIRRMFRHFDEEIIIEYYECIGHVLNEQGTGYEHIFSWYEHSISIELKMGHVI